MSTELPRTSFRDDYNDAVLGSDNVLNFFYDDLVVNHEASAGAVAYIKIYGYTLAPDQVNKTYQELPKNIVGKPVAVTPEKKHEVILRGKVLNAKNQQSIPAEIMLRASDGMEKTIPVGTDGNFKISLPPNSSWSFTARSKGFMEMNDKLTLPAEGEMNKNIMLQPIEVGQTVTMHSIIFMQGKYELLPESFPELDRLAQMLHDNKTMEIEISGHTDNQGDPKKNLILSEQRVKVVKDYLVSKGASPEKIKGKGYGGTKPIADNADPETRKLNRRVEFMVLKK
jgi:outer membrane protein OmpA-like peptidoglycan-associated protein